MDILLHHSQTYFMYLIKNMEKDDIVYLYDLFGTFAYQQSLEGDILNF